MVGLWQFKGPYIDRPESFSECRRTAIVHSIMSACQPPSFISPILLTISVYFNQKYESRELVDILSSLSFAENYREIQRLYGAFLASEPLYDLTGDIVLTMMMLM